MFKKVLVSEDLGSISNGIVFMLEDLHINSFQQVQYCDDAYLKIKKAIQSEEPFDLLITDLSFIADHRQQKYPSGEILIKALKQEIPALKIIAYSIEDRPQKVRNVMLENKADAFVCKGRNGLKQLEEAIFKVYNNEIYLSPQISNTLRKAQNIEIDDFDIEMMKLLAKGLSQDEISQTFKSRNINPCSLSAIEKRFVKLRTNFSANNSVHLISIAKDLGLI